MKDICIKAVSEAAGRSLKAQEINKITESIIDAKRQLAREDRNAWVGMSEDERMQAAADRAGKTLQEDASRAKGLVALKIKAYDKTDNFIKEQLVDPRNNGLDALDRYIAIDTDGRTSGQAMESRGNNIKTDQLRQLVSTFEASSRRLFGLFDNAQGVRALMWEIHGQDSSKIPSIKPELSAMAKEGADGWRKVTDSMRDQYNRLGGNIGDLGDNWHLPQNHSQKRVFQAGLDGWVNDQMGWIDRRQYVNEDGSLMNDEEMEKILKSSWDTISTGGALKTEPGSFRGNSMLANRHSDSRVIFYKDADSYLANNAKYGGSLPYDSMVKHIQSLSRDTAALEYFGPNAKLMFNLWLEKMKQEDIKKSPGDTQAIQDRALDMQKKFDFMSGGSTPVINRWIAKAADVTKDTLTVTKLGMAPITSANHQSTMNMTASYLHMSHMQLERNYLKAINPLDKTEERQAHRFGLAMETYTNQMNHWAGDNLGAAFSKTLANASVRASGLSAHLDAMRRAFAVTRYGTIGDLVSRFSSLKDLNSEDAKDFKAKGITDANWEVWKLAKQEDWGNGNTTMITPEAIYAVPDDTINHLGNPDDVRRDAVLNMMGMVNEETANAVITPTANERYNAVGRYERGTLGGELRRSVNMFKAIPEAQIRRNLARGMSLPTWASRAAYIVGYVASTMLVGAMVYQFKQIMAGKDPENMMTGSLKSNAAFWIGSFLNSGAAGVYADAIFDPNERSDGSLSDKLLGPLMGTMNDTYKMSRSAIESLATGKKMNAGSQAISIIKNNMPFIRAWYSRAIIDRLIFNQLQENISPGYMNRTIQRAHQSGQQYFYPPNKALPQRLPNLSVAVGQ